MRPHYGAAYYNEFDPKAAAWLRELIKRGLIAYGDVDERSVTEVTPADLTGYTQCHFFAGIGGWSLALRLAGWPDDRPVWTGSCPCQPFSSAGKGKGGGDNRHLWPYWARLIRECRPVTVFGEQVESAIAHGWLDAVFDDLEGENYACGAVCLPAASVGAPHIRQRLWFVADGRRGRECGTEAGIGTDRERWGRPASGGPVVELADTDASGRLLSQRYTKAKPGRAADRQSTPRGDVNGCGPDEQLGHERDRHQPGRLDTDTARSVAATNRVGWSDLTWLPCRDGKARPTQSGLQPLAHGVSARVGRLRGYGNAIVPQVAAEVIAAYMDIQTGE